MHHRVTIVMYHYVRPLKTSPYPKIKGLELKDFREQLAFFQRYYSVVRMEDVLSAVHQQTPLPQNALLLTFDDGYQDHYQYVFPLLKKLGWQGSFFPPGITIFDKKVLDVNKIHYILASVTDIKALIDRIFSHLDVLRTRYPLPSNEDYYTAVAQESRYDDKNIMFVKRMLQKNLPESVRSIILDALFSEYVTDNEEEFSNTLYLNLEQLKEMKDQGMFIGGHGHAHAFLDHLDAAKQRGEIESSLKLLSSVGASLENWVMCYPYGAYDASFLSLLSEKKCGLGLTLNVGIANLETDHPLELPRLDTNDFPKTSDAPPNHWVQEIL